jgi:hypothetical protein
VVVKRVVGHLWRAVQRPAIFVGNSKMSVQDGTFRLDRVIEKLATSDKVTLVVERLQDGKMRVTSNSWEHEKVLFRTEVLEVRCVEGRLHVSRKVRRPDTWDPPVEVL